MAEAGKTRGGWRCHGCGMSHIPFSPPHALDPCGYAVWSPMAGCWGKSQGREILPPYSLGWLGVGKGPGPPKTPSKKDIRGGGDSLRSLSLGGLVSRDCHLNIFSSESSWVLGQLVPGEAGTHSSCHLPPPPCPSLGFFAK